MSESEFEKVLNKNAKKELAYTKEISRLLRERDEQKQKLQELYGSLPIQFEKFEELFQK